MARFFFAAGGEATAFAKQNYSGTPGSAKGASCPTRANQVDFRCKISANNLRARSSLTFTLVNGSLS